MKGMDFGNSPVTKKQVPVSEYEDSKGTMPGSKNDPTHVKIKDLERRLFVLREDLKGGSTGKPPIMAIGKTITKIEAELKKLRAK